MHSKKTFVTITQVLMALILSIGFFTAIPSQKAASSDGVTPGTAYFWKLPADNATSHAFDPAAGTPWAASGYIQEEEFMTGTANVYDNNSPTNFNIHPKTSGIHYTTRVLIRRPNNPANFSGNVIVEFLNPSATYDLATGWISFWQPIIHAGDIWVGVTCRYVDIDNPLAYDSGLKKFDAARYAPLNFSGHERELCWDMFAQLGYALKNNPTAILPSGFTPSHLIGHGYSQTGAMMITWINFFDPYFVSIYDAYNPMAAGGPVWINDSDLTSNADLGLTFNNNTADPRRLIQPCGKPVIHMCTETEVALSTSIPYFGVVQTRIPDSDANLFRHYEVPGGCHMNTRSFAYGASPADVTAAMGVASPWCCAESQSSLSDFHQEWLFHGAYVNLKAWMLNHAAFPPKEASFITTDPTTMAIQRDANGNALGGARSPEIDVPVKTYLPMMTPCPSCGNPLLCAVYSTWCVLFGQMQPLACSKLAALYTGNADYLTKFNASVDSLTTAKWLDPADVAQIKSGQAAAGLPSCGATSATVSTGQGIATFSIKGGGITGLVNIPSDSIPCSPSGYIFPFGLFSYSIVGLTPGGTSYVTITTPTPLPLGSKFFKCQNGSLVDFTQYVQQTDPNTFILTLTDGGQGDADGIANGTIVDPCGPAYNITNPRHGSSAQMPTIYQPPAPMANIAVQSASLSTAKVAPGAPVTVTANVANKGTAQGSTQIKLYVNGQEEANQGVTLSGGTRTPVKFTVSRDEPGTYSVYVGSIPAGTFEVDQFADPNIILYISGALLLFALVGGVIFMATRRR